MAKKDKNAQNQEKESFSSEIYRKFKQSPGLYIGSVVILVLVTITFIGGDFISGGGFSNRAGDYTFGYYNKEPISWVPGNFFQQTYDQITRYYQSQGVDTSGFSVEAQIWRQAYETTVVHTAILQMMKRSKYSVPVKTVDRQVAQLPQFLENGRFSSTLYNQMSESSRLALWRQMQEEITKSNYYGDFVFGLLTPSAEAEFIADMSSVMRTFEMVSFSVDAFPDAEYLSYAQRNPGFFRTIHLSRITVSSSERDANNILNSIKSGATTFEDAARAQSQDGFADRGGDMGSRYVFELDNEIPNFADRETILNLRRGEYSDIIFAGDRWMFFRVEDEIKSADFDDFSTMERVRSYVRNYNRGLMEDWSIARAEEFTTAAGSDGFDEAVLLFNLQKHAFGPVPVNFGGVELFTGIQTYGIPGLSSTDVQNLSNNENFWRIAFSTRLNTPSQPFVQGNNVLVLYPVDQTYADETMKQGVSSMYSSYWVNYVSEQTLQYYFINNSRMDDRFWDTFFRYFSP
ncbi:MAG: SurA N-terminal domain-containing protein [Treponema sp.]|nr:SurA N-terminal domain-containing protein [Treponema sp.]